MKKSAYSLAGTASKDGTAIGYRKSGRGPGLVIIHGAFVSGHEYERLAQELADTFTVYVVDRRGRLYSGPQGEQYSIEKECEDALAVLEATGAPYLFGHSYGGLIALELARTAKTAVTKLAVYEPAVSIGGRFPSAWMADYKWLVEQGRELDAFVAFLKGMGTSRWLAKLPGWLLRLVLLPSQLFWEGRKLREKLPTLINEMEEVFRLDSTVQGYGAITAETLVMAGNESTDFMCGAARAVAAAIPGASFRMLKGLGHNAPDFLRQKKIAEQLKLYFAGRLKQKEPHELAGQSQRVTEVLPDRPDVPGS
ncbi:alpha/beta fold hydrolase [Paenibacillus silvisoli]|uniref:alpha/beta fold hydrolase n=1 Tax=Paenibacillus silvisoli TaxID=3110539 RepID=UPI002805D4D3|nr:alpha/beta hydrolase [Paenibacillus silvisoli]